MVGDTSDDIPGFPGIGPVKARKILDEGRIEKFIACLLYTSLPGMKLSYQMAFAQVTKAISKGEFSKEDFKNLLEVYEDGTEKTKG